MEREIMTKEQKDSIDRNSCERSRLLKELEMTGERYVSVMFSYIQEFKSGRVVVSFLKPGDVSQKLKNMMIGYPNLFLLQFPNDPHYFNDKDLNRIQKC